MRFYEYACEACGKQFDKRRREDERDEPIACPDCGSNSTRNAFAMAERARNMRNQKAPPFHVMDFECEGCGNKSDRIIDEALGETNDNQSCGICGAHLRPVFSVNISRESERYSARENFDPGAGRTFRNARERRQWMAEQGVVEMGTEAEKSIRATHERERAADEACRRNLEADMDYYRHNPDPAIREAFANLGKTLAAREVEVQGRKQSAVPLAS